MQRTINFIIDKITGFDINKTLDYVISMDNWERQEILDYQFEKWQELLFYATKTEYYKSFKNKPLSEFPVITKDDLRRNLEAFKTNIRKTYKLHPSSGTTGSPFYFHVSKEMLLMKRVSHQKMLHWYGLNREAREMKVGGPEVSTKVMLYYLIRNKKYLSTKYFHSREYDLIFDKYCRFKPEVLYGYPSTLHEFAIEALNRGIYLLPPKIIVTHAENLYKYIIDILKQLFPTSYVANQYWATEANIGTTCPKGKLHIDEDTVICEIMNINKEGVGDLLITNLFSFDFPLIRYKMSDRIKLSDNLCECGRKTRIIEYIEGRESEHIQLNNGKKILIGSWGNLLQYFKEIKQFQIAYSTSKDKLFFYYRSNNDLDGKDFLEIKKYFNKNFEINIEIIKTNKIAFEKSGKFKVLKTIE